MANITYTNKVALNVNADVPDINKVKADDMNEIKEVVNKNTPVGAIEIFAGSTAPSGWLICDGSAVSRTTYANLFAVIGTTYGNGDGSTTFNVPDLKGKVIVGQDTNDTDFDTLGETGGSKELQRHNHKFIDNSSNTYNAVAVMRAGGANDTAQTSGTRSYDNISVDYTGTGNSGNLQPYIVMNYIISY